MAGFSVCDPPAEACFDRRPLTDLAEQCPAVARESREPRPEVFGFGAAAIDVAKKQGCAADETLEIMPDPGLVIRPRALQHGANIALVVVPGFHDGRKAQSRDSDRWREQNDAAEADPVNAPHDVADLAMGVRAALCR